jgi:dCMP deaminase
MIEYLRLQLSDGCWVEESMIANEVTWVLHNGTKTFHPDKQWHDEHYEWENLEDLLYEYKLSHNCPYCPVTNYHTHPHIPLPRPTLEQYFTQLLPLLASRGTCVRRQVAAIVTNESGHLLGCGYNGVPAGEIHCLDVPCPGANDPKGNTMRCRARHAEENALMQAGTKLVEASRLYCSCTPCLACSKLITVADKIKKVYALEIYTLEGIRWLLDHGVEVFNVQADGHLVPITEAYFGG